MLKYLLTFLFASVLGAQAQVLSPSSTVLVGNPISAVGFNPSIGGSLFIPANAILQRGSPITISYDIKTTSMRTATTSIVLDTRSNASNASGFLSYFDFNQNSDFFFMFAVNPAGSNDTVSSFCRANAGHVCTRESLINDGLWHHVCQVFSAPTNTYFQIDGYVWDRNTGVEANNIALGYTPSTTFWSFGASGVNNFAIREFQAFSTDITPAGCALLSAYHKAGLRPTSGPLTQNLMTWLPFDNCTSSGCNDISGNNQNALPPTSSPTCSAITPSNGFSGLSGNQTVTATCTDPIGIARVDFYDAGVWFASSTTAPYTATWPTTNSKDGTITLTAIATNVGGLTGQITSTGTTNNGIAGKTFFVASTGTSSTCLTTGNPCPWTNLQAAINANHLHGGDNISILQSDVENVPDMTAASRVVIAGPNCTAGTCDGVAQNATPGLPITISTYNGGSCNPNAGVTSGCGTVQVNANGTVTLFTALLAVINVQNVQVTNLRFIGSQTNVQSCPDGASSGCGMAVKFTGANGWTNIALPGSYDSFTNNEVIDFSTQVWISTAPNIFFSTQAAFFCGINFQNNYLHGSSLTSKIATGMETNTLKCITSNVQSLTYSQNVGNNIGGFGGSNADGSPLFITNVFQFVDTLNVTGNFGTNNTTCGGPYGNWQNGVKFGTQSYNESYNVIPTTAAGCDKGTFDLDNGVNTVNTFGNYGHNSWGPCINILGGVNSGITTGNLNIYYNICENNNALVINQNSAVILALVGTGFFNLYGNTIWNGFNGRTISPNTSVTQTAALGIGNCMPTASVLSNNINVSNGVSFVASAEFWYGGFGINCNPNLTLSTKTNDWWGIGSGAANLLWRSVGNGGGGFGATCTTLACWNAAVAANDLNANPGFAGSGGGAITCYTIGSGSPSQPGLASCPAFYKITNGAATENTGTDLSQAPFSLYTTALDYYGDTVPYTGHGGSGTNIGADGAFR